jgi:hypothetical protein
LGEKKMLLLS